MTARPSSGDGPRAQRSVLLERGRRLSESMIWPLQRAFYEREGLAAWKPKAVPYYITSNAFTARAYARTVAGFLRDLVAAGPPLFDPRAPVYVVELAAGSGQFACLFLRRLLALRDAIPALRSLDVRYVMTDFAQSSVDAWPRHERLAPFFDGGQLDCAAFDLESDRELRLRSGTVLAPGTVANPVIAIANYTFDSTAQDAFQVADGFLHERLASVYSAQEEPDRADPAMLPRIELRWESAPVAGRRYDDPLAERVLARRRREMPVASFLLPTGAFRCVRNLWELTDGRLLLLCGDKALSRADELAHRDPPRFYVHGGGCFSFQLDLLALAQYFEEGGGRALVGASRDQRFKVGAYLGPLAGLSPDETRLAFREEQESFSPADYYALVYGLRNTAADAPLEVLLSQLRLGSHDYEIVFSWRETLAKRAPDAPPWLQAELADALDRVWEEYFPMQRDLALEIARILLALKRPERALFFCRESLRLAGPQALTLLSAGYACVLLGREREALAYVEQSLAQDGENPAGRSLHAELQRRLDAARG
ncbi:MAG: hypothetical protein ABW221_04345 [Vicinamibacteria bacterium]